MKIPRILALVAALVGSLQAANIVWVSDQITNPNTGLLPDQGLVDLLSNQGHTLSRFNPPDTPTALSAGDVSTLNSYDLVIVGRSLASGSFDTDAEILPWNTQITKPMIVTNSYLARGSRLGWFVGSNLPDSTATTANILNPLDPVSGYIIQDIGLDPFNTTDEPVTQIVGAPLVGVDQGLSTITDAPVTGGTVIATTNAPASGKFIVTYPQGTTVQRTGGATMALSGYRMVFLVGNREPVSPNNSLGQAGYNNLTGYGESMFIRSVEIALNNGAVPVPEPTAAVLAGAGLFGIFRRRRA